MADQEKPQETVPAPATQVKDQPEPETETAPATESLPEPASEAEAKPAPAAAAAPEAPEAPEEPEVATEVPNPPETQTAPESVPEPTKTIPEQPAEPAPESLPEASVAVAAAAAAEPAPEATTAAAEEEKEPKPEYITKTPALEQLFEKLPDILSSTGHDEMWGVSLKDFNDAPTVNVVMKFLRANDGNVKLAEEQLIKALQWRKQMDPLALVDSTSYDAAKFGGLGYLTTYPREGSGDLVVTWNLYGAVKNIDQTFGDMDEFVKWRVALMELAVRELKMDQATEVMDYNGEDPYRMIQVHDYLNVSFLRLNPNIRAATKKTIEVFSTAYPELLREKFFVNVPAIMGWMFAAIKLFVSANTTRKFHPISNGANLAREFPTLKDKFPKVYGGSGPDLEGSARTVSLEQEIVPEAEAVAAAAA